MSKKAYVFPGLAAMTFDQVKMFIENSQFAWKRFAEADEILGLSLKENFKNELEEYGPFAQCAFVAMSVAALDWVESQDSAPADYCVGGSFGGMVAAVYAGSITYHDAVQATYQSALLERELKSQIKQDFGTHFLYRYPLEKAEQLVEYFSSKGEWLEISAYINENLLAVTGSIDSIEEVKQIVKAEKRSISLDTINRMIHCSRLSTLNEKAKEQIFDHISFMPIRIPVISDVDGVIVKESHLLKQMILDEVDHPIRWDLTVQTMKEVGVTEVFVMGPTDILGPTLKHHFKTHLITPQHVLDEERKSYLRQ
ncbi:ACP S-malonyltransferase [Hazenella coriacea]|uniref:[acyl-carrier-protein] S-malonyltransferase n=1 Tax=Hazenella coriacea TaxID=1179467 RepID=A0A4R3KZX9_9BACL|nr:acyltransferase domain-containing protein [Hazenella coriacea]TCS92383.1 malonyl CoA-acyl carrier protein transacylase [Hazenella coriacea]